ncbi:hypothetical protein H310_11141 [Aphanomyces invadans]|uniref:Uncharacterized protein n=1 Tax=Aphanomyces invadans TaxID=157072 RepID=A0A024TMH4_9STRA|nr:hypothetical protein H310_11141 [Aphanomyces invadans]ETV95233.1 hypothetical protein H310_11141 [Aphanomyces invadans]|eukprot:XP_008875934.1 hypothetical protein H310_11141 [Aphanomyces invadans]
MPSKRSRRDDSSGSEDSDSDRRRRSEKKSSKKKTSTRSRHRDSSDSDSSSSSGSDSDDRKHKKRKKHKDKKSKRDKKAKKHSKAIDQSDYGKYGILRESDFHAKAVSFNVWLREVKKISDFNGPKWEAMELFKEYMEDYNTATLPHEKYYDVEKYEMRQHRKKEGKRKGGATNAHDDEEAMRRERLRQRVEEENKDFSLIMQTMSKEKIENMRYQEKLRTQMQLHYKSGNVTEARRLEALLNKVDDKSMPSFH